MVNNTLEELQGEYEALMATNQFGDILDLFKKLAISCNE